MTTAANAPVLAVPDDLTERDQFVPWRREVVGGRETKVTYSVRGHRASSTNPRDWSEFQKVVEDYDTWWRESAPTTAHPA